MKNKTIQDYSVSKEKFELEYDSKNELYKTIFTNFEKLGDYYKSENYISHTDGKRNWFEKVYQKVKEHTIKTKWNLIKKFHQKSNLSVLDIGCGTGDFLKFGIDHYQFKGIGVEPNDSARFITQSKNVVVEDSIQNIKENSFDVISLWHVLEHVSDLDEYFNFFQEKLNQDGLLIIAVPNYKSFDATYYKDHWAAWDVPRHLWHFSKSSIENLIKPYHFELIHIEPMYFDSYYVSLLSEEYKTGSKNILKAFWIGFLSNLKAKKSKEYSSHIYFFKKSI